MAEPVMVDHALHAGKYRIGCLYCHGFADKAAVAGIPSLRRCAGCHKFVAKDNPKIKRLFAMIAKRQGHDEASPKEPTIMWPRVYQVPGYVYFSHRVHVQRGVACSECHGAVETMKTIARATPLDMGFCLRCHQQRGASTDCLACHQ